MVVLESNLGLTLAHLSHSPSPFCFSYFSNRVSHFYQADLLSVLFISPT
jgi:hypothetical protein